MLGNTTRSSRSAPVPRVYLLRVESCRVTVTGSVLWPAGSAIRRQRSPRMINTMGVREYKVNGWSNEIHVLSAKIRGLLVFTSYKNEASL